jgi:hypothetical protein
MSKQNFSQLMLDSARATATKPQYIRKGRYELSANTMQPLINEKNSARQKMRNVPIEIKPLWKEKPKEISMRIKDATATAKAKWNRMLANQMNDNDTSPKEAWKMFREMQDGVKGHHTKPISMRMRMEN